MWNLLCYRSSSVMAYTCIMGDSGTGKTCFFDTVAENAITQDIEIKSEYPFVPVTAAALESVLDLQDRHIIFIDEANVFSRQGMLMRKLNRSHHLFLCIGRGFSCNGDYPLQGIYKLSFDSDWFKIENVCQLNVTERLLPDACIITEAAENHSENELLKRFF